MSAAVPFPSLAELDRRLDSGRSDPVELLDEALQRIEARNRAVNAFVHVERAGARAQAEAAARRQAQGARLGPLDGVPYSVKDNLYVAGMPATWGSALYADFVPERDDLAPAALARAGAVCLGKTNTPEFALMARTQNDLFGATRNPLDLALTPGGSSGGAAAALADGMGAFALGTDAGGSIRRPAGFCGLAAIKASPGMVPRRHGFPATMHDFQAVAPMARSLADLALVFAAIRARPAAPVRAAGLRVGLVLDGEAIAVDADVAARLRTAAGALESLGHAVEPVPAPWDVAAIDALWATLSAGGMARLARGHAPEAWEKATAASRALAEAGARLSAADYVEALDAVAALRGEAGDWFARHDLLLMPVSPCAAWPLDVSHPAAIGGRPAGPRGQAVFLSVANAAGLPALALPVGADEAGRPVGAQLVGPAGADDLLFAVAAALERELAVPAFLPAA